MAETAIKMAVRFALETFSNFLQHSHVDVRKNDCYPEWVAVDFRLDVYFWENKNKTYVSWDFCGGDQFFRIQIV